MRYLSLVLCALALAALPPARVAAADRVLLEPAAPGGAPDPAAWKPAADSGSVRAASQRTPRGGAALAFPFDMATPRDRVYYDRDLRADLARFGRLAFWMKVEGDASAIGSATLYVRVDGGWYGAGFAPPSEGWSRVVLDRSAFEPEESPVGWQAVQGLRLAFWRGSPGRCTVLLGGLEAESSPIGVVLNTRADEEARRWAERLNALLAEGGIDAGTVTDVDVEQGALEGKRAAILPLNPRVSPREVEALRSFVARGGKVLACYVLSPEVGELIGVAPGAHVREDRPGAFASMRAVPPRVPGLPAVTRQASWNIIAGRPAGRGARVAAQWHDADGNDTGYPALIVSETGAYLSHVVVNDDQPNKVRLLRAVLGLMAPEVWQQAARTAVDRAGTLGGRSETFSEAAKRTQTAAAGAGVLARTRARLDGAREAYAEAQRRLAARRYADTVEAAERARSLLAEAYALAQKSRPGEFRAVWCHNAYGVAGLNWDEALRRLKGWGFTAVVPNMLWGGVADYPSEVLPVRDAVAGRGDQIALCLAAARKHGLQMHVWKVNWNLDGAPEAFVARMRAERRLQWGADGKEHAWLCPSHPANQALEHDAMLEVARNYDVDGIHFDYIRYPDGDRCYCEGCRERFAAQGGPVARWPQDVRAGGPRYAAYQEFRRDNITRLVRAVRASARTLKPKLQVSAAVFPDWPQCREHIGQDWGAWVREGLLDFVCPMNYTASDAGFRGRVRVQNDEVAGRIPLYPGIGASAPGLPAGQVIDQVRIVREAGLPGFIVFEYGSTTLDTVFPALGRGITRP